MATAFHSRRIRLLAVSNSFASSLMTLLGTGLPLFARMEAVISRHEVLIPSKWPAFRRSKSAYGLPSSMKCADLTFDKRNPFGWCLAPPSACVGVKMLPVNASVCVDHGTHQLSEKQRHLEVKSLDRLQLRTFFSWRKILQQSKGLARAVPSCTTLLALSLRG